MKAVYIDRFGPSDVLIHGERPAPRPGPGEVLIEVHAASVNPRDWLIRSGRYQMKFLLPKFPFILGSDVSGTVVEVGGRVERFAPGGEVYAMRPSRDGFGGYAELVAVRESAVARKPESMSHEEAAGVPLAALTALQALRDNARLGTGQEVVIVGASGGVGTYAVQIAKVLGAEVTGVASAANARLVESLGADRVIDYKAERFNDVLSDQDVVFDVIGRESPASCSRVLRPGGTYVTTIPRLSTGLEMLKSRLRSTFSSRARRSEVVLVRSDGSDLERLTRWIEDGRIATVIDSVYPLAEAAKAHDRSRTFRTRGKLILKVR